MQASAGNDRFVVHLADGSCVEAVWYPTGTLCLSSQVGCPLGCPYCASGAGGLLRNLSLDELHLQLASCLERGYRPQRLTLSGVGEPLANFPVTAAFLREQIAAGLPVSLTTTGYALQRLTEALHLPHNGLMLSVHAGCAATHRRLVPRGPEWEALWQVLGACWPHLSRRARRRVGINYLLLEGVNDASDELHGLIARLRPLDGVTVHLLQFNPVPGVSYRSPEPGVFETWRAGLLAAGLHARRANAWRRQADGGCGTLLARRGHADAAVLP